MKVHTFLSGVLTFIVGINTLLVVFFTIRVFTHTRYFDKSDIFLLILLFVADIIGIGLISIYLLLKSILFELKKSNN